LRDAWCGQGEAVELAEFVGMDHRQARDAATVPTVQWLADRIRRPSSTPQLLTSTPPGPNGEAMAVDNRVGGQEQVGPRGYRSAVGRGSPSGAIRSLITERADRKKSPVPTDLRGAVDLCPSDQCPSPGGSTARGTPRGRPSRSPRSSWP